MIVLIPGFFVDPSAMCAIVVSGTPEQVAAVEASYTGQYLKKLL